MTEEWFSCWCYEKKKMVNIKGKLESGRIAQILTVEHCDQEIDCDKARSSGCLIGTKRESRWKG